jgi:hypothetical protein
MRYPSYGWIESEREPRCRQCFLQVSFIASSWTRSFKSLLNGPDVDITAQQSLPRG